MSSILGITKTFYKILNTILLILSKIAKNTWNSDDSFFSIQFVRYLIKEKFLSPTMGCAVNQSFGDGLNPIHKRSLGGGGIFNTKVPIKPFSSTLRLKSVLETPSIAFFMYLFSVAAWKNLDSAILSTIFINFLLVLLLPPKPITGLPVSSNILVGGKNCVSSSVLLSAVSSTSELSHFALELSSTTVS